MAIEEDDREDLLRDGKSMTLRGETTISGETIVVGFRSEGQMSLYSGADPVFQFNRLGQLRRVFFEGERYAAENRKLIHLSRESKGGKVRFERIPIDAESDRRIRESLSAWISRIQEINASPSVTWRVANEDKETELLDRFLRVLRASIAAIGDSLEIARDCNV